jgi:hypothetical protein
LEEVVKSDIKRITAYARLYEDELVRLLTENTIRENQRQNEISERELEVLNARDAELDVLFERIYEDSVSEKISEERFLKMSRKYEDEQAETRKKIEKLESELQSMKKRNGTVGEFLKIVRRYTRMKTLTPGIVREFIDKIVIHHREKIDGADVQKIEISYNCIGAIELPDLPKLPQQEIALQTRKGVTLSYSKSQQAS